MTINLKEDIKPISYIKANAAEVMKYVNESHNSVIITQNGEARAVLMGVESYQEMKNAFGIMTLINIAEEDVAKGNVYSAEEVFSEIERDFFRDDK